MTSDLFTPFRQKLMMPYNHCREVVEDIALPFYVSNRASMWHTCWDKIGDGDGKKMEALHWVSTRISMSGRRLGLKERGFVPDTDEIDFD